ncbi:MAG: type II toxin-antitoxin system prevent-host-death family antitoxin [Deltaproteobacteria bacterium]
MSHKEVSVAEAKKHLSDLLGRVAYRGERITISKRGKPMAILVPATEPVLEEHLGKLEGWLEPGDPFFGIIDQIISDREKHSPRVFEPRQE